MITTKAVEKLKYSIGGISSLLHRKYRSLLDNISMMQTYRYPDKRFIIMAMKLLAKNWFTISQ